ncbi:MAG: hypothetical protein ACRD96_07785 [Bryobacteraceae bacterium]
MAPARKLAVCPDPEDDVFLECADAARADFLNARGLLDIIGPHLPV